MRAVGEADWVHLSLADIFHFSRFKWAVAKFVSADSYSNSCFVFIYDDKFDALESYRSMADRIASLGVWPQVGAWGKVLPYHPGCWLGPHGLVDPSLDFGRQLVHNRQRLQGVLQLGDVPGADEG